MRLASHIEMDVADFTISEIVAGVCKSIKKVMSADNFRITKQRKAQKKYNT